MSERPGLTPLGRLVVLAFVLACFYGAWRLFVSQRPAPGAPSAAPGQPSAAPAGGPVTLGLAYGTEKKLWLQAAVRDFAATPAGRDVQVELIPMGSLEAAQAVLAGDRRIQAWSPASALYKDIFLEEWRLKHGAQPILREDDLALTPMVFVLWAERHEAFVRKYGQVSLRTIGAALREPSGWSAIAGKPEWGLFKFGHTHPNESNSGLMTLVLMAYEHHQRVSGLTLKDVLAPGFQAWMGDFERGVSGLSNSTGNMMRDMVLRGPSSYDGLLVYESVAIDYIKGAEGRWGELRLAYPERNMWNENPYYVLDVPWSSPAQRKAATALLEFLMSEPAQKRSLEHGFRPGNPSVPVKVPGSPFVEYQRQGLRVEVGQVCEPPKAEVLNNLLASWQRSHAR